MKLLKDKVVLHVLPALKQGGVEHSVIDLALAQRRAGLIPIVVSSGGAMVSKLNAAGIKHFILPVATKNPFKILWNVFKLKSLLETLNVSFIHAHSRAPAWTAYLAAKQLTIPFITTYHGVYGHQNYFKRWYNSVMLKGAAVIAPSQFVKDHIVSTYAVDAKQIHVVAHGINISTFIKISKNEIQRFKKQYKIPSTKPVISIVGRLTRLKGHRILFEALARIKHDFTCLVVGPARKKEDLDDLKQEVKRLGLSKKVLFTGGIEDVRSVYAHSDLLVSASIQPETFGLTALEAHAFGVPVIGTNHGGVAEIIQNGQTGFLVKPNDLIDLANGLNRFFDLNPTALKKMGQFSRRRAALFDQEKTLLKTLKIYEKVLSSFLK